MQLRENQSHFSAVYLCFNISVSSSCLVGKLSQLGLHLYGSNKQQGTKRAKSMRIRNESEVRNLHGNERSSGKSEGSDVNRQGSSFQGGEVFSVLGGSQTLESLSDLRGLTER